MTVDRLSALDECFLRLDAGSAHMHLGWTLLAEGHAPSVGELRAHVADRLELLPRFRRRVATSSLQLHDPVWTDDPKFELAHHVRRATAPTPDARGLRELAGSLLSVPLDHSRPLWRLHLVDGLGERRFALIGQAHHALVDGIAAVEMAQLLLDGPEVRATFPVTSPVPRSPQPGLGERMLATLGERARLPRAAASFALRALVNGPYRKEIVDELRRLASAISAVGTAAPRTSINTAIGPARSVAYADIPLHMAKELGRRSGASVNDVVLATAALALGGHLRRLGESHPWLRVLVPVGSRPVGGALDDQHSVVFVELPLGERDPGAALDAVARQTREHRQAAHAAAIDQLLRASDAAPPQVRSAIAWIARRPQTFNAVISSEPGPREAVHILDRRVRAIYPAVPLLQGHGLSIAVLSYCGSLHVGLYADPGVVGRLVELAADFRSSFEEMCTAVLPQRPTTPTDRARRRHRSPDRRVLV